MKLSSASFTFVNMALMLLVSVQAKDGLNLGLVRVEIEEARRLVQAFENKKGARKLGDWKDKAQRRLRGDITRALSSQTSKGMSMMGMSMDMSMSSKSVLVPVPSSKSNTKAPKCPPPFKTPGFKSSKGPKGSKSPGASKGPKGATKAPASCDVPSQRTCDILNAQALLCIDENALDAESCAECASFVPVNPFRCRNARRRAQCFLGECFNICQPCMEIIDQVVDCNLQRENGEGCNYPGTVEPQPGDAENCPKADPEVGP